MNKESLKGHSELLILSALAQAPMHGYALSEHLKGQLPEFKFGVGMIYPLLHRLEQKKQIKGEWKQVLNADRRVYSLTRQGKKALQSKRREWRAFSSLVTKVISQPLTYGAPIYPPRTVILNRPQGGEESPVDYWRSFAALRFAQDDSDSAGVGSAVILLGS